MLPGSSIKKAIAEKDYDSYIEALKNLEGFPEGVSLIDKKDFEILTELKKEYSNKLQEDK